MARAQFADVVINTSGDTLAGVNISVYDADTLDLITIYDERVGGPTKTNPFSTTSDGRVEFFADTGSYDINIADPLTRIDTKTIGWDAVNAEAIPSSSIAADGGITIAHLDEDVLALFSAPEVTALPSSPVDGQRCLYKPSGENVRWAFQYDASESYWYFTGGSPVHKIVTTQENMPTTSYGNPSTTGPQILIPFNGDWTIRWGLHFIPGSGGDGDVGQAVPDGAGYTANDNEAIRFEASAVEDEATESRDHKFTGLTAGTLTLKYKVVGGPISVGRRWMSALPVRAAG